jgi:hypothetical protein
LSSGKTSSLASVPRLPSILLNRFLNIIVYRKKPIELS